MIKNTRVVMKMLKVFSNQLRRIHKQVQNLLSSDEQMNPEEGLTLVASLDSSTGKLTKYSEPVRMTPKLRDLKKRED